MAMPVTQPTTLNVSVFTYSPIRSRRFTSSNMKITTTGSQKPLPTCEKIRIFHSGACGSSTAVEDPDFLAGGQRLLAAGGGDFHFASGEPPGLDGRIREHTDLQHRGLGYRHCHDYPEPGAGLHSGFPRHSIRLSA